jgi:rhamnogalacturonyl hydrolase YesR
VNEYLEAALKLHKCIVNRHWDGKAIVGPDPIGRTHWRVTRFVRSYLPWLPGDDRYTYLQGQGYWIRANLALFELTEEPQYLETVNQCADNIVQIQPANGAWLHPPIWGRRGFISTVEGVWGSLGLTAAYRKTGKQTYLDSALKWYEFQINFIGFQQVENGLAVNYYAHSNSRVPNVTTMLLLLMAELYKLTNDEQYLEYTDKMIRFIEYSQFDSGELPYAFHARPHFMCYQYNSFEFLDVADYYDLTQDKRVRQIMSKLANYLSGGLTKRGSCRYDCFKEDPETNYWTATLAAALRRAHHLGLGQYQDLSERAYRRLLSRQNFDGSFDFSDKNYHFLADRRSYPRQQAMILNSLLLRVEEPKAIA